MEILNSVLKLGELGSMLDGSRRRQDRANNVTNTQGAARTQARETNPFRESCAPEWDDWEGSRAHCQPLYDRTEYPRELPPSQPVEIARDDHRNRFWDDLPPIAPENQGAYLWGGYGGTQDRLPDVESGELPPRTKLRDASEFPFPNQDNVNTNMNPFLGVGPAPFFGSQVRQGLGDVSQQRLEIMTGARGPFRQAKRAIEKAHPRNRQNRISQGIDIEDATRRTSAAIKEDMPYQLPFQQMIDTDVRTMPFGGARLQPELRVLPVDRLERTQHLITGYQNIPSQAQANPNLLYQTETSWQPLTRGNDNDLTFHRVPVPGRSETLSAPKMRENFVGDPKTFRDENYHVNYTGHAGIAQGEVSGVPLAHATTEARSTMRTFTQDTPYAGAAPAWETSPAHPIAHETTEARATMRNFTQDTPYVGAAPSRNTSSANAIAHAGWEALPTMRQYTQDTPYAGAAPAWEQSAGHPLAHATTEALPTMRTFTQDAPQMGAAPAWETTGGHIIGHETTDARATMRQTTADAPYLGNGPGYNTDSGHVWSHETTEARPTIRYTTENRPYLGGPAGFEHGPEDQTAAHNLMIDDRKEIGTYNRMPAGNRYPYAMSNNQQINIQLRPDDCTDYSRTPNLEVSQYSSARVTPAIQVPNDKYSNETACYYGNPIEIVTRQDNPYANDIRRGFSQLKAQ